MCDTEESVVSPGLEYLVEYLEGCSCHLLECERGGSNGENQENSKQHPYYMPTLFIHYPL